MEKLDYSKAIAIIKGYPEAIKFVIDHNEKLGLKSDSIQGENTLNLNEIVSIRTANVLKKYFSINFQYDIDLFSFPVRLIDKINVSKIGLVKNCGIVALEEIQLLIENHKVK